MPGARANWRDAAPLVVADHLDFSCSHPGSSKACAKGAEDRLTPCLLAGTGIPHCRHQPMPARGRAGPTALSCKLPSVIVGATIEEISGFDVSERVGFVRLRQGYGGISSCQRRHPAEARAEIQTRAKEDGGESGIRTHGRVSPTHAFQACSFNHSDISPFKINDLRAVDRDYRTRRQYPSRSFNLVCIEWFAPVRERPFGRIV